MTADPLGARQATEQAQAHLLPFAGRRDGGSHAQALADAHDYGLAAETAGYAGVWIAEHHLSAAAAALRRVAPAVHGGGRRRSARLRPRQRSIPITLALMKTVCSSGDGRRQR
ncbi:hypothetical protein AB0C02_14975 [Micromonospora sp. NPDC048999]|uniref:hypothetical protein n=1 Tax=Micromonospora sp. NPDC048999 TaxID=3155391 RepID=UPI0033FA89DD